MSKFKKMVKNRVFLLACSVLTAAIIPALVVSGEAHASITNTRVDAAGTVELGGASWLGGAGVDIYSNGNNAANEWGNNCVPKLGAVASSYCPAGSTWSGIKWQCVEMISRLYLARGWIGTRWQGNGNTLVNNVPSGLTKQNNGAISYLDSGDVITLDDGGYGHGAVINSVSGTIQIVNQNTVAVYSSASISSGALNTGNASLSMSGWAGYSVQAVVHHSVTAPPPAEITTMLSASSSGPISNILEPSGRRSIFTGSDTGNLYWSHWTPGDSAWTTAQIASPGSAIKGIASVRWNDGRLVVYYGTAGGGMYESWYQPGGGWNTNLIASVGSSVNGLAAQVIDTPTEDQINVFYGSSDGAIRESWWKTGLPWSTGIIDTVSSPVNAVALLRPTNGPDTVVFSGTASGELHEDYWRGPGYSWTGAQQANFGTPISSLVAMMYGNTETVYAGTATGNVVEAWFTPGDSSWSTGTVGTYSGPVTALTGTTYSSGHVGIVAASSGNLGERFWSPNNSWAGGQIAALGNIVLGAAIMQTPAGAKIVYTVSNTGQIQESWWAPGQSAWTTGQIGTAS